MGNNKIYWWILGTVTTVAALIAGEYATTIQKTLMRQEAQIAYLERTVASIDTKLQMIMDEIRRTSDRNYAEQMRQREREEAKSR